MDRNCLNVDLSKGYPVGSDIEYECGVCGDALASMPVCSVACKCRNVIIDVDAGRVAIKDNSKLKARVIAT